MNRIATTEQVAAALHVKPATVRKYARERRLPFDTTPGGHRRFDVDEAVRTILGEGADEGKGGEPLPDDDSTWEPVGEVPYVHVEPGFSVLVHSTATSFGDAPVAVVDSPEGIEQWAREYPVV